MRFRLHTLLIVMSLACILAGLIGWTYRMAQEVSSALSH
jgi:hypothetical protein